MNEKKYSWGGTKLTIEELREVDPMAAADIEYETPKPLETKSERKISDLLLIWIGIWIGGTVVALYLKG